MSPETQALTAALKLVAADLKIEMQVLVDAKADCFFGQACFSAGTPLRVLGGWAAIEDLEVGSMVLSRDEWNSAAANEYKVVEEVFKRFSAIWELNAGGRVIGSTSEHPFYARERGWVACRELAVGDTLLCEDGTWIGVEGVRDTGRWEPVYNLRVAEYHTYFVGTEEWGFGVWAHNICQVVVRKDTNWNGGQLAGKDVYGTAQNTEDTTGAHADSVNAIVAALAPAAPSGTYFVLNRTWRTAIGRGLVSLKTEGAKLRPDILIVEPLDNPPDSKDRHWKIHAVEVLSGKQTPQQMQIKMRDGYNSIKGLDDQIAQGNFVAVTVGQIPPITW